MEDSVFTKIIKGEIPCHKVFEDEFCMVLLDIHPLTEGHALVVAKKQIEFVWDLPDEDYQAIMKTAKRVALKLREVIGTQYVSERIVGVDVPHAHVQLIPFNDPSELSKQQDMESEPDHEALASLAKKLSF